MELVKIITDIRDNIERVMVGRRRAIDLLLTALIAKGHVLLEDVPGTGKTMLAKSLAKSMALEFSRVQFTPDLLPSDVTGLNYYNQKEGEFVFRKGPVFTNILLADEINRATPRTQSSLLECMEERQVTMDGLTRPLALPFFVIATQNPVETSGTYPLPEAQLDRFLMQIAMGYPDEAQELQILERFKIADPYEAIRPVCSREDFLALQEACQSVYIHPALLTYLVSLAQATRKDRRIVTGVSPRGSLAFSRAVRAYALVNGRKFVVPEDIKELAVPVLAHRLVTARTLTGRDSGREFVKDILDTVPVPTEEWKE